MRFYYSTNDGKVTVADNFTLRFSKASDTSIHFYRDGTNLTHIARVKQGADQIVGLDQLDATSRSYTLQLGDRFVARNNEGQLLLGQITGIKDDTRGAKNDEVVFTFVSYREPQGEIL